MPPADPVGLTPLIEVGDAVRLMRNTLRSRLNRHGEPSWDISMDVTTISAGSFDVVSSWQQFCDDVTALGRLIVVTEYNPCPMSPATQFVRAPQKQRNHTWGFHVVQCQYKAWMSVTVPTAFYMYVRPDMHWFVPLRRFIVDLWKYIPLRDAWVPDCENAWGVNDRFAILNTKAASAYFTRYTHFIDPPRPRMKTENILKYALESRNISVGTVPTVGALTCCRFIARCVRKRCRMVRFGNVTVGVKYPFEAQAAVQNAEQFSFGVHYHRTKIVLTRPPQVISCFTGSQNVCVVGNGPLTDVQRKEIDGCETVYRFNNLKNWREGEKIDVHVQREWEGTHVYAGEGMAPHARRCLVGMHADNDAGTSATALNTRGLRAFDAFKTCKTNNSVSTNPSAGTILLSTLQADHNVSKIDVYGMNWAFSKSQGHSAREQTLVDECCTKCEVHQPARSTYA